MADEGKLLDAVRSIAMKPDDAKELIVKYRRDIGAKSGSLAESEALARKIVSRYSKLAAGVGGASGLAGFVPGIGTVVAAVGGATADAAASMKLQVDMCLCLAEAFGYDTYEEESRNIAYLVAATGSLEKSGLEWGDELASPSGVEAVKQYARGAALQMTKEFFKRLGVVLARKAVEKALPFGIGSAVGASANFALTKYVGNNATEFFRIDAQMRDA